MSRLFRFAALWAVLLSVTVSLLACSAPAAPAPTQPLSVPPSPTAEASGASAVSISFSGTPTPAAKAVEMDPDQLFRVNLGGDPPTLDPNLSAWDVSYSVVELVFEGLVKLDQDSKIQPALAAEVPSRANGGISEDGKRYTFKLRSDAKYSDGKAVTAKDFEFSLKRLLDTPYLAAPYAPSYNGILGAEEYNRSKEKDPAKLKALKDAVGVKARDDRTLEVTLSEPRASFLQLVALWPAVPLREELVKTEGASDKPDKWTEDPKRYLGTGPFKMTEWVRGDHITLVPNENYYGPKPKLKKVVLTMVSDAQAEYAAFLNGEREIGKLPTALFEQVQKDPNLSKQLVRSPRLSTTALVFNHQAKPLDNLKLRQALSTAIDRDTLIQKVQQGVNKAAYSWIPPGVPGHQPDLGKQYKLDPARAKQFLSEAGYPGGQGMPALTLQYPNVRNNGAMAQFLQEQWKVNLGIDVKLEPMEARAFTQAMDKGQYTMGFLTYNGDYPDPDNWLPGIFASGIANNYSYYSNPKLDDLMKRAVGEQDEKKRLAMWEEAQKMVVDDAVMAFILHQEYFFLLPPNVKEMYVTTMDGGAIPGRRSLGQVWIAKK